jgi:peptidoglycan-N-acetylmuramic acid deacetylase
MLAFLFAVAGTVYVAQERAVELPETVERQAPVIVSQAPVIVSPTPDEPVVQRSEPPVVAERETIEVQPLPETELIVATPEKMETPTALSWFYMKKGAGQVPDFPATKAFTEDQQVMWVGSGKKVYLTFDTGASLGDVERMIRILADNDVKATYFITGSNMKKQPEFIKLLVDNGHLVANHSMTHRDFTTLTPQEVEQELADTEAYFEQATGQKGPMYFRFPYGKYSAALLTQISALGYTSVFWSTAMKDWVPRENGAADVIQDIMGNLHDGNIILLHQASEDNLNALDDVIKQIKAEGYQFAQIGE